MIRPAIFSIAVAIAAAGPLAAQDHSGHTMGASDAQANDAQAIDPKAIDPKAGASQASASQASASQAEPEMDHCAMGHLPPEQCPPKSDAPEAKPDHSKMDHSKMNHSGRSKAPDKSAPNAAEESAVPARAFEGPRHAADAIWGAAQMAPSRQQLARENGAMKTGMLMVERLEARAKDGEQAYLWDAQGWYGGDINRFVFKTEGEGDFGGGLEEAEFQALFSHAIGPFFDLQAGARYDIEPRGTAYATIGLQGLAPYMFHVDAALFLSERGDLTARVEAEYDQKITQSLILQPRIEIEGAAQSVPELGLGNGLTKIEGGLRLRYEITRQFAPYVGVEYEAKLGGTADIARSAGESTNGVAVLAGIRAWF